MIFGRNTTEVKCPSHYIISRERTIRVVYRIGANLHEVVFVFFHCKVNFPLLFPCCALEGSHYAQPTLEDWGVTLHLLECEVST